MLPAWRKWPRSARKLSVLPRRAVMAHTIPMNDALPADPAPLTARECKDLKVLALFTVVYCREHHPGPRRPLSLDARSLGVLPPDRYPVCPVCAEFLIYAFDRRIRTHVPFEMPAAAERERIWALQVHPKKTPLASDVDFRSLAERFAMSGGDIKNAVIKAAAAAA